LSKNRWTGGRPQIPSVLRAHLRSALDPKERPTSCRSMQWLAPHRHGVHPREPRTEKCQRPTDSTLNCCAQEVLSDLIPLQVNGLNPLRTSDLEVLGHYHKKNGESMSLLLEMPRSFIHSRCRLRHWHLRLFLPFRHSAHNHRCSGQIDLGPEEQEHAVRLAGLALSSAVSAGLVSPSAVPAEPEGTAETRIDLSSAMLAGLAWSSAGLEGTAVTRVDLLFGDKLSCSLPLT